jgi:hypothetical protein
MRRQAALMPTPKMAGNTPNEPILDRLCSCGVGGEMLVA